MRFNPPVAVRKTHLEFPVTELNKGYNGVFRATFKQALKHMPHLKGLLAEAWDMLTDQGFEPHKFEIDIKVHMLMPNQFPCIPNWHCDNVPRGADGKLSYDMAEQSVLDNEPPMFLWVSGTPCTKFLNRELVIPTPDSHAALADVIKELDAEPHSNRAVTQLIKPNTFYRMDRLTPHQGTASAEHCWRVFMRLTHRSCLPDRPKTSVVRRHSQVYLDSANFGW